MTDCCQKEQTGVFSLLFSFSFYWQTSSSSNHGKRVTRIWCCLTKGNMTCLISPIWRLCTLRHLTFKCYTRRHFGVEDANPNQMQISPTTGTETRLSVYDLSVTDCSDKVKKQFSDCSKQQIIIDAYLKLWLYLTQSAVFTFGGRLTMRKVDNATGWPTSLHQTCNVFC